tara:strand:- start:462 stop:704 length:243 start_codon:yes stop_codon:yes gene_type:complete
MHQNGAMFYVFVITCCAFLPCAHQKIPAKTCKSPQKIDNTLILRRFFKVGTPSANTAIPGFNRKKTVRKHQQPKATKSFR